MRLVFYLDEVWLRKSLLDFIWRITTVGAMVCCETGQTVVCLNYAPVLSARSVPTHRNSNGFVSLPRLFDEFSDTFTVFIGRLSIAHYRLVTVSFRTPG